MTERSRREMLCEALALGVGGAALAVVGEIGAASATPAEAAAEVAKFTGGKPAAKGRISIDLPEIAENGNTVPLTITVESPMTADDHVTDILVVAEGNPRPGLATFHLTPMSGRALVATRVRLAVTENVVVVAKTSKGEVFTEVKPVKVTIGGCGG
ncbi:MAG TPA: thiosulfate oxidation carrier protein SoxY [Xanthobacteraceae bacterium]|nr:thiosulfate oxidation carrier protein SoxY [Xanthobacteraceae bacterium]